MTAPRTTLAILLLGLVSVVGAWFFELVVKLMPCEFCIAERWFWYAAIPIALAASATRLHRWAVRLFVPLFLASTGFAIYHVGFEQHVFPGPSACTASSVSGDSVADLSKALMAIRVVPCDEVQRGLSGISLAGFDAIASLAAATLAIWSWHGWTREGAR